MDKPNDYVETQVTGIEQPVQPEAAQDICKQCDFYEGCEYEFLHTEAAQDAHTCAVCSTTPDPADERMVCKQCVDMFFAGSTPMAQDVRKLAEDFDIVDRYIRYPKFEFERRKEAVDAVNRLKKARLASAQGQEGAEQVEIAPELIAYYDQVAKDDFPDADKPEEARAKKAESEAKALREHIASYAKEWRSGSPIRWRLEAILDSIPALRRDDAEKEERK
jgi:hypothetical protein